MKIYIALHINDTNWRDPYWENVGVFDSEEKALGYLRDQYPHADEDDVRIEEHEVQ